MRAKKTLWPQIDETFKQMDTAAKELECFQVLQKQEQLAASNRVNNIWEEVKKQKELERTLQKRYGDLLEELERTRHLMDEYRAQAQKQEEIAANNHALELAESAANQSTEQSAEDSGQIAASDELGSAMPIDRSHDETAAQQMDTIQEHAQSPVAQQMDTIEQHAQSPVEHDKIPPAADGEPSAHVEGNGYERVDGQHSRQDGGADSLSETVAVENKTAQNSVDGVANDNMTTNETTQEHDDVKNQPNTTKQESGIQETVVNDGFVDGDAKEVSGSGREM